MKSIIHSVYRDGRAGLSNLIMSVELGVVLAELTNRLLVLKNNATPIANVVQYDGIVRNSFPSRVTDLIDLGVPWINAEDINLDAFAPQDLCPVAAWDALFYFPAHLATETDDFVQFARGRSEFITVDDALQHVPALAFTGGQGTETLCFYSYFFYLDRASQLQALDALKRTRPKPPFADLAHRVAADLGSFNAAHIRRGDFKKTMGVTTLERTPGEALEALDHHFSRQDRLLIVTDEAEDPFFEEIKSAYPDHVFIDHHMLENYGADFFDLPAHDSIALAYLSQLVAAQSRDFIGTMTSTFTSIIQRMRGNQGRHEPFKFLWNELPDPDQKIERGRHPRSDIVPLDKGIMIEQHQGPYSWNRVSPRLNPGWMREWPEGFLDESTLLDRCGDRPFAPADTKDAADQDKVQPAERDRQSYVSFLGDHVALGSNDDDVDFALREIFEQMVTTADVEPLAEVHIAADKTGAQLLVDRHVVANNADPSLLLRHAYREVVSKFIFAHPKLIWVHAGCAATASGAILLPGAWGRGKSSLVLELYEREQLFLSDDIAPLDPSVGMVVPFPGTPQIRNKSETELPRDRLGELGKSATRLDPQKVASQGQPLAMIAFPHYAKGAQTELRPISPGEAVGKLLENCLSFTKNDDATIQRLCEVVADLPVYTLRFGDVSEAADLLLGTNAPVQKNEPRANVVSNTNEDKMSTEDSVRDVEVEVTLTGGRRFATTLPSNSPILHDLHAGLALNQAPEPQHPATLVQLPLNGGKTACSFLSNSILSVVTTPPVLVELQTQSGLDNTMAGPAAYVRIDDFLTPDENKQLLEYALANESAFEGSKVTSNEAGYRKSHVHYAIKNSDWRGVFLNRLKMHLPHITSTLDIRDFRIGDGEIQLTASNDGDFFKAHPDAEDTNDVVANREITYVYYMHRTPRPYSGGNLLFYSGAPGQPVYDSGKAVTSVEPANNCLIAFASTRWHEVDMVRCPNGAFADSRFTVNGWLRRASA